MLGISEERSLTGSLSDPDSSAEDDTDLDFEEPDLFHFIPDTWASLPLDSEEAFILTWLVEKKALDLL